MRRLLGRQVENPLPLPEQPSFLEGSTMIRDLVPTLASALKEVCDALKEVKSIASELDNMQKLFSLVRDAVKLDDAKRDREVTFCKRGNILAGSHDPSAVSFGLER